MTLQEQVNAAIAGAVIQHDTEFIGNLVINKAITIQGTGIIRTPNADPAVRILPKTGQVTLRGLEITSTPTWPQVHDLVRWGAEGPEQDTIEKVPTGLTIENCDIHGQPNQISQRGIAANGANLKLIKSKVREIHGKGFDTQAICTWNGPGPFLIEDCYLEAAGENVMFGGAFVTIPNLVPSNITIRRCHFFKPLAWKGVWTVKNHFELKNARNVVVEDCKFENCWRDAQDGYSWLFTVRGEAGDRNAWNTVQNVTMRNCEVRNCYRGVQTLGLDYLAASTQGSKLSIINCSFEEIADWFLVMGGFPDTTIEHVTHRQGGNIVVFTGKPSPNFTYINNATQRSPSGWGFKADGGGEGVAALNQYCPGWRVQGSVIAAAPATLYPTGNFFPPDLSTLSSFKGTDGFTPGRIAGDVPPVPPPPTPSPTPTPDTVKPVAVITSPTEGQALSGKVAVNTNATDNDAVGVVYLVVDDNVIASDSTSPYSFDLDTARLSDGQHFMYVRAWDKSGNSGDSPRVNFTVRNAPIPTPVPPAIRTVAWPKQPSKQNPIIEGQWRERYRLKRTDDVLAEFEKVV